MRRAASLLELVIAIVVMGIAMMTLPLMLTTTQSNNTFAMQQEAILAARTQVGDMLTYLWDEHSIDSNGTIAVLDTNSTYAKFERHNNSVRRIGHVKGNKRRKYFTGKTYATTPSLLGKDGSDSTPDDIDDFDTTSAIVQRRTDSNGTLAEDAGTLDYKFDFNMTTTVSYVDDNFSKSTPFEFSKTTYISPTTGTKDTTNIKMTTLTLIGNGSSSKDLNITLRAYSCNIGANQLLRRSF